MTTAEKIRSHDLRSYNAWHAQAIVYGLPTDDASFVAWWTKMEAQESDRMRAIMAR
jgi:hypothetical protein